MTKAREIAIRTRGAQGRAPWMTSEMIAELAYRLTMRDRQLLTVVWEHRVLTTTQLATLFFPSAERARQRLNRLHGLHALLRFRPWTPTGSKPWHWVLGPAGARVLAIEQGQDLSAFGYRQDAATAIAVSSRLSHQIGVNDFFVTLHAHAAESSNAAALEQWWSEHRCAALWGDLARPDAFGRWTQTRADGPTSTLDFFLEHDTGTETLARVTAKLGGYADLAEATGITTPVLFWLPSAKRETNLRRLLGAPEIPVATAVHAAAASSAGPAGPVWQPAGDTGPRRSLSDLARLWRTVPRQDDAPGSEAVSL